VTDAAPLYPPAPAGIPPDLTRPGARYRMQVALALLSLLLFVAVYLALVAASAWLVSRAFTYPLGTASKGTVLLKIGAIAGSVMLFLFLLKGLFKRQQVDRSGYLEVSEAEQPELFAFIRRLCKETRAPFPRRVYLSPEVNAAVFYDTSFLSLVLPVRKNLLIGLGLVNVLPLDEFKAVLAHEFGHFSQSSMKVGSYVYVANRILADMVYGRDAWDDLLAEWRQTDVRIAVFGWALSGVVWALRLGLAGVFRLINFAHLAMSRQMEFNADLVAVSATGSDALVHALARLDFAGESLNQAVGDLLMAKDHKLYSADLFHHQRHAAAFLRTARKQPQLGEPPDLPADPAARVQVFAPGEGHAPSMWATHPSNHDREQNAKRHYVRSPRDDRSPWLLFRAPAAVRERVTRDFYRGAFGAEPPALEPAEKVQAFIDEERRETTYDPRYHGMYDGRLIQPGDLAAPAREAAGPELTPERLAETLAGLYGPEVKERMEGYTRRQGEFELLARVQQGVALLKAGGFEFRGQTYRPADATRLLQTLQAEDEADLKALGAVDRRVFLAHQTAARHLGAGLAAELVSRYRFHLGVQEILGNLMARQQQVNMALQLLGSGRQLSEGEAQGVMATFDDARGEVMRGLNRAARLALPPMKNLRAGTPLGDFLLDEPLLPPLDHSGETPFGPWLNCFLRQFGDVLDRTRRVHFKSLSGVLALQEEIARRWQERQAAPAEGQPTTA
jgi:Zn-dependent protease with chaperone function